LVAVVLVAHASAVVAVVAVIAVRSQVKHLVAEYPQKHKCQSQGQSPTRSRLVVAVRRLSALAVAAVLAVRTVQSLEQV
jgi:hypothetical protein